MPADNNFTNNQLLNAVLMWVSTDEERGVPELFKIVGDLRDMTAYICTDLSPNPTWDGGGTWTAFSGESGAPVWSSYTPAILGTVSDPSGSDYSQADQSGDYCVDGDLVDVWVVLSTSAATLGSGTLQITLPVNIKGSFLPITPVIVRHFSGGAPGYFVTGGTGADRVKLVDAAGAALTHNTFDYRNGGFRFHLRYRKA